MCQEAITEVERLRKELKGLTEDIVRAAAREVKFRRAVDWLYGFWDGNCLVVAPGCDAEALHEAWADLLNATAER